MEDRTSKYIFMDNPAYGLENIMQHHLHNMQMWLNVLYYELNDNIIKTKWYEQSYKAYIESWFLV